MDILIEDIGEALWVAAVDKTRLMGLELDPRLERVRYGSIYLARVKRIDASMDAAYLDLDGETTGLLHNRDVRFAKDGRITKGGAVAIGKTLSPGDMILVQARSGYLPTHVDEDVAPATKMPLMTMDVALHGRYLIHTPMEQKSRISRRIKDPKLRKLLDDMLTHLTDAQSIILRKAAAHTQTDMIMREAMVLGTVYNNVRRAAEGSTPHLILLGPDAAQRILANEAGSRIDHIDITSLAEFEKVQEWCEIFAPDLIPKMRRVDVDDDIADDLGLFQTVPGLMEQLDDLLDPYVVLPGGGNVIIEHTAALTAMDVNSGPDRRGALAVNLEAARMVAHHIRLRNLGGIMMIDFIKMPSATARRKVMDEVQNHFDDDPCTVQIHGFTRLGLLELTRHRRTPTFAERLSAMEEEE